MATRTKSAPAATNGNGQDRSPPVWSRKVWTGNGNIEVAVFEKTVQSENGNFQAFNVAAKRTYKQGNEYKDAKGFRYEDLPHLILVLQQAHAFVVDSQHGDGEDTSFEPQE